MKLLKEDYSLIRAGLDSWVNSLKKEIEAKPLMGKAKEVIDDEIERAERLMARITILGDK